MKIRQGFVSNSSSSSFVCSVCGEDGDNYNELFECSNGHVMCSSHAIGDLDTEHTDYPCNVNIQHCPICQLKEFEDKDLFKYILKINNMSKEDLIKLVKQNFKSYDLYQRELK